MSPRFAVAICLHHKPWLAMGSLISLLLQDRQDYDLFLLFNQGDGSCPDKPGYEQYRAFLRADTASSIIGRSPEVEKTSYGDYDVLARMHGVNPKLSPFDPRLYEIAQLRRHRTERMTFENDQALDSGVWLKFIRSGAWRPYDYVFCFQEGTLLTNPSCLSDALVMAQKQQIEFLASAHMKGRLPRKDYDRLAEFDGANDRNVSDFDRFHSEMVRRSFDILERDPGLAASFARWTENPPATRQCHLRDVETMAHMRLLAILLDDRPLTGSLNVRRAKKALRALTGGLSRFSLEFLFSRLAREGAEISLRNPDNERIFADGARVAPSSVAEIQLCGQTFFHPEDRPGWHAACCNHMFSNRLLTDLAEQFDRYALYDVLDVPFSGSALELFWTYVPYWLGRRLWYWDGFDRIIKDPWTNRRGDSPQGIALNLNRYVFSRAGTTAEGDLLKVRWLSRGADRLKRELPALYF